MCGEIQCGLFLFCCMTVFYEMFLFCGTHLAYGVANKINNNHLKGKKHGNYIIIYFLPVERFRLFLAVLEMRRLV